MANPVAPVDLAAIRRIFDGGSGERPSSNTVLQLCDEVEQLRETNAALAREVAQLRAEPQHYRDEGLLVHEEGAA